MTTPLVLGIDFGTCRTSAAVRIGNTCQKVPLGYGVAHQSDMPTAVFIGSNGNILVGDQADNSRHLDPCRYFGDFKRRLGSSDLHEIDGATFRPEDLVAAVLRYVRQAAEKEFQQGAEGSIDTAVLTVPTIYSEGGDQWKAMEKAGRLAGFTSIHLVREPDAAAVYYDSLLREGRQDLPHDGELTLVYDLGGGTFDPALIRCSPDGYLILKGPEDAYGVECGGLHFDRLIQGHFARAYPDVFAAARSTLSGMNPEVSRRDVKDALDLLRMLVEAKGVLSSKDSYEGEEPGGGLYRITRKEFEGMISPLLDQTIASCESLVKLCPEAEWKSIKRILLVGGSSQIPLVGKKLDKMRRDNKSPAQVCRGMVGTNRGLYYDPGLAVGYGAAVIGATTFHIKPRPFTKPDPAPKPKSSDKRERPKSPAAIFKSAQALATGDGVRKNVRFAHKLFLEAAEAGYAPAQVRLAEMYAEGEGCNQDNAIAREWYKAAAGTGNKAALLPLGLLFEKGLGGSKDLTEAFRWYMEAAKKGDAEAVFLVASMLDKGRGIPKNTGEARIWYEIAARSKNPEAMFRMGQLDELASDLEGALKWFTKAEKNGHTRAKRNKIRVKKELLNFEFDEFESRDDGCDLPPPPPEIIVTLDTESPEECFSKAEQYRLGKDYTKAVKWYKKAADGGLAVAQFQLGYSYDNGQGVPRNYDEAFWWYAKAAEQGDSCAQCNLGALYHNGQGVIKNLDKAKEWYCKAIEAGNKTAKENLALLEPPSLPTPNVVMYEGRSHKNEETSEDWYKRGEKFRLGVGIIKDCTEAEKWYRKAAESGHVDAKFQLAELLLIGDGVPMNTKAAFVLFEAAANAGNPDAQFRLGFCYKHGFGTDSSIQKAKEWYKKAGAQGHAEANGELACIGDDIPKVVTFSKSDRGSEKELQSIDWNDNILTNDFTVIFFAIPFFSHLVGRSLCGISDNGFYILALLFGVAALAMFMFRYWKYTKLRFKLSLFVSILVISLTVVYH